MRDVASSTKLRQRYGHKPERFAEFTQRYRGELSLGAPSETLRDLRIQAAKGPVVLVTATKEGQWSAEGQRWALTELPPL